MIRRRKARVVLVGDIGGPSTQHVGDEAMFGADLALVRRLLPDHPCVAVSADPEGTNALHGVDAVGRAEAPAVARDAGLLVVTGGGNLNSLFPDLLVERLELAQATADGGGAIALLGQMLGPELTPPAQQRIRDLLALAMFVGVRDRESLAVARRLGVPEDRLVEQLDDAWTFGAGQDHRAALDVDRGSFIAVTLHPDVRIVAPRAIPRLAEQLGEIQRETGLAVALLPHYRARSGPGGTSDEDVGAAIAAQLAALGVSHHSLRVLAPGEVAAVTRASALTLSTRYHPLVFALSGGVPALALWTNEYVASKQRGALAAAHLEEWMLGVDEVLERGATAAVVELWERRSKIRGWLATMRPEFAARVRARDDALARSLRDAGFDVQMPDAAGRGSIGSDGVVAPRPTGRWSRFKTPTPGTSRRCTVVHDVRLEVDADHLALVARFGTRERDSAEVHFRVHDLGLSDRIDASATPFLPVAHLLAASNDTDLLVDAPVDVSLLENTDAISKVYRDWWGWRPPEVDAPAIARDRAPAPGVGLWYSRGVDSTASLVRALEGRLVADGHALEVTHLLGLDWIDPPDRFANGPAIWSETAASAASIGLPLLRMTTDVRNLLAAFVPWKFSHGAVLAGLSLVVGPQLGTAVISASASGDSPRPLGSHPRLDPLFGTASTRIAHLGCYPRSEKIRGLLDSEWALDALKVCWEVDTPRNCGRCAKCLATMTVLHCFGALDRCDRFDADLSAHAVRAVARAEGPLAIGPHMAADVVVAAATDDDLHEAWKELQERLEREIAVAVPPGVAAQPTDG